jgi:hypothetical protein
MNSKPKPTLTGELAEAKQGFERWRRNRRRQRRIPDRLWRMAAKAAAIHGVRSTARRLGLNSTRLRQRMEEFDQDGSSRDTPRFLELPWPGASVVSECFLEMEGQDGRKLRIQLKGEATAQALALGRMLWEGER